MKKEILLDVQQTTALLVLKLGSPVAWAAWLADLRRTPREGKRAPTLHGHQLHPTGQLGAYQAMYRPADVKAFIVAVLAADPGIKKTNGPRQYVFDDYGPLQHWRTRKVDPGTHTTMPVRS